MPIHNCRYSKVLFQSHPRICLVCGQPEFVIPKEDVPQQNDVREDDIENVSQKLYDYVESNFYIPLEKEEIEEIINIVNSPKAKQTMFTKEEALMIWKAGQEYWKTSGASITFEELTQSLKQPKQ
mgnify:CR=1 FL=1